MAHNFQRPSLPYENESLQNDKRYQLLTRSNKRPPTDQILDTDVNYLIDAVRTLDEDIAGVTAGILPGADNPDNANFFPTTNGEGVISWTDVSDPNVRERSLSGSRLLLQTITALEIMDGTIPKSKMAPNAIGTSNLEDEAVKGPKVGERTLPGSKMILHTIGNDEMGDDAIDTDNVKDLAITGEKVAEQTLPGSKMLNQTITENQLADNSVPTSKMPDKAVTAPKVSSQGGSIGNILTATASNGAAWLPPATAGRILQINTYTNNVKVQASGTTIGVPFSFTTPFTVNLTPVLPTSRIFLFASASYSLLTSLTTNPGAAALKLFVNNNQFSTTNEAYQYFEHPSSNTTQEVAFFSALIPIPNQGAGTLLSFEIKGVSLIENWRVILGGNGTGDTIGFPYYMHAIEVDI